MDVNKSGDFVRQAAILAGASILVRILGFVYRVPLTNIIGDVGNAYYIAAFRIYTTAIIITSGALIAVLSKLTSERIALRNYKNAHALFKRAMGFAVFIGILTCIGLFLGADIIADWVGLPNASYSIRALSPAAFFVSILVVFRGYFQGLKTAKPTAISQVIEQIVKITLALVLVIILNHSYGVVRAAAGAAFATSVSVLAALITVFVIYMKRRKAITKNFAEDFSEPESRFKHFRVLLYTSFPIVFGFALASAVGIIDLTMATNLISGYYFDDTDVRIFIGQFEGKFTLLVTLPVSMSMAIASAVLPEISSSSISKDMVRVREKINMALRLSMILSFPSAVGISVLAAPILSLLFPAHPDGWELLAIGGGSIIFMSVVHVTTSALQGIGKIAIPLAGAVVGLIVKIPVNLILMPNPNFNIQGAVISTLLFFVVGSVFNLVFLYKYTRIFPDVKSVFLKPFIASVIMGGLAFGVYSVISEFISSSISTILAIGFGAVVFVIMMKVIKGFMMCDMEALPIPNRIKKFLCSS